MLTLVHMTKYQHLNTFTQRYRSSFIIATSKQEKKGQDNQAKLFRFSSTFSISFQKRPPTTAHPYDKTDLDAKTHHAQQEKNRTCNFTKASGSTRHTQRQHRTTQHPLSPYPHSITPHFRPPLPPREMISRIICLACSHPSLGPTISIASSLAWSRGTCTLVPVLRRMLLMVLPPWPTTSL